MTDSLKAGASRLGIMTATPAQQPAEQKSARIRIGVLGYGYWGPQLVRNLDRLPVGCVTCVADLSPERRQAAQLDYPAVRVVAHLEDVLAGDVDAVVIATPIRTHHRLARLVLEHGKHVFVEKPLAASSAQARDLIELADMQGLVLMVGHTYLYNPAVEKLRQLVGEGALGNIYYVDAVRANLGLFQSNFNVIWDLAPHDLSILNYILGASPLRVSAHGAAYLRGGIQDVAHLTLEYPRCVLAHVQVSWLSPSKIRRFTVVGDRQMAVYDDVEATEKIRIFNRGVDAPDHTATFGEFQMSYRYGDIVSPHIHWAEPLAVECRHFAEAILEARTPLSDGANGLEIVRILEATDASLARDGAFITLEGEGRGADESASEAHA
jgi:predicted dehydrogenase